MTIPNSIEWQSVPIGSLKPYSKRLRRHDRHKIDKLKKLLGHFGQVVPIIVDAERVVIDGHAVLEAMRELGADEIKIIAIAGREPADIKALRLALNRLPAEAAWDNQALQAEFKELIELSFDLTLTGFDTPEIDHVLDLDFPQANVVENAAAVPAPTARPVSVVGDMWLCERHRIGCGSAHDAAFVGQLLDSSLVDTVFIDPPYNVPVDGFVSGKGRFQHREFVQGTGEMSSVEFTAFLRKAFAVLKASCSPQALLFACMDWRHIAELLAAGAQNSMSLYNLAVWVKSNAGMGSLYRSQHELVAIFQTGSVPPLNNVQLGRHGRNRSNVWHYRGFNAFGGDRDELLAVHPTVKPVALIADVLRDVTRRGASVLDTFVGSGSTIMAAEETGRRGFGVDLDPLYVDVAVRRWQIATRGDAIHAVTGERFNERAARLAEQSVSAVTADDPQAPQAAASETDSE